MRAQFRLNPFPRGPLLTRLQARLEALQGVRAAVLEPQDETAYVDFDPPVVTTATIEATIRRSGVAIANETTEPHPPVAAAPTGMALDDPLTNPDAAMARLVETAEVLPARPGGSLMPEAGEASRAAFPGHNV